MANSIFREKNIEKINSPESLNDYVKVTNPSVWIILVAIVLLIIGAGVFGAFTKVDTDVLSVAEVKDGKITAYVDESELVKLAVGMQVRIDGREYKISSMADRPKKAEEIDEYVLHKGNMEMSRWIYPIEVDGTIDDGVYPATIIIEQVSPLAYVFN